MPRRLQTMLWHSLTFVSLFVVDAAADNTSPPILPPEDLAAARAIVEDVAAFIMTTDVGSGFVKGFNMTRDHLHQRQPGESAHS